MTSRATWRSEALGGAREVEVPQGRVRVHETGSGAPLVFVHGFGVNANLWRKVVPHLSPDFRCVTFDLPLGSHTLPMRQGADLTPTGLGNLIADAIESLGLEGVILVGNDTGGALCQIVAAHRPERLGGLVLTSCDAFENFPPKLFRYLKLVGRVPGGVAATFAPMRLRAPRRLPIAYGWAAKGRLDRDAEDSYVMPILTSRAVRRDVSSLLKGIDARYTIEAAERLKRFEHPALIAWSRDDRFFPPADAERLAATLPDARLEWIEDARTFSPEDQPERLAELIGAFAREPRSDRAEVG